MRKGRSLIIVPFDKRGERVLDTIRRALTELGVEVSHLGSLAAGNSWATSITDAIRATDFLVVDVTRQNPNVMYELGFAHALRKPTILIVASEEGTSVPSDLAGFIYIVYEESDLRSLAVSVSRGAASLLKERSGDE